MGKLISAGKKLCKQKLPVSLYRGMICVVRNCEQLFYNYMFGGVVIHSVVLSVGQACNFKCKDCGNFAPYSPDEFLRYPIEDIIHELDILFSYPVIIKGLQIQGGEPFCYSDMSKLLDYLGEKKRAGLIRGITIATNGSITPSDEILRKIKEFDVRIRISDYNIAPEKTKRLEQKCDEKNIRYRVFEFASVKGLWYDLGGIEKPRENDDATVEQRYWRCQFNNCLTLEHGELTYCSRATNSYLIQNFERNEKDYFILSDKEKSKETLKNFLSNRHFMEACRYCNGTNDDRMIPPAIQLGSDLSQEVGNAAR